MNWSEFVADRLAASFGGFATFCTDPDDFLEEPTVREALARRGVTVHEWSGERSDLMRWHAVSEDDKPLVKVASDAWQHLIEEILPDSPRLDIGVSSVFPKLDPDVVRSVPKESWNDILRLQSNERPLRTRRDSALMVARVVYGVDHAYIQVHGLQRAVEQVAANGHELPPLLVQELLDEVGQEDNGTAQALQDAAVARAFVRERSREKIQSPRSAIEGQSTREQSRHADYVDSAVIQPWTSPSLTATEVQDLALIYGSSLASLSYSARTQCNRLFADWLVRSYDLMLTAQNPSVYRVHRLAETIDKRLGSNRGIVFVVDAMSLEAWFAIKRTWIEQSVFLRAEESSAFVVIPTLTSWSRRAFFEGKLPPQFENGLHGPALERKLWERRLEGGRYFDVDESQSVQEAIYQGVPRIAVVDVSWDKRGHAIDPDYDSLCDQARRWAEKSKTMHLVNEALASGYRVFLTADHGQAEGRGLGVPNVGNVPEDRSKRVIVFAGEATRDSLASYGDAEFQPITMPKGTSALFARYGETFDHKGASSYSHGGCSIEEVMVPFVEISR